jgi:hypothetical protein
MHSPRELNAQVSLFSGRVLSIGGVDNNGNLLASAEVYSPGPGAWTLTGSMAEARELFPAVVLTGGTWSPAGWVPAAPCWQEPSCTIPQGEHGPRQVPSRWLVLVIRPPCSRAGRC